VVADKNASEGEFKLFGRAVAVDDPEERDRYCVVLLEKLEINAEDFGDFHIFAIDLETASYAEVRGQEWYREFWSEDR
jgi:hypothetical protein